MKETDGMGDGKKPKEQPGRRAEILPRHPADSALTADHQPEQHYMTLMGSVSDVIYSLSPDGVITSLNLAFEKITGLSCDEWIGKSFSQIIHPDDLPLALEKFLLALRGEPSPKFELRTLSSSGNYLTGEYTVTPQVKDGKVINILGVVRDITEHKKMLEKMRFLSLNDELTGMYNRRGFFPMAEKFLMLARRQRKPLILVYLDLNNLKTINDTMGHHEGDKALMDIADILKKTFRATDIIGRMGGDEFAVIPVGARKEDVDLVTGRLLKNIEGHNAENNRPYKLSISYGVSCYDAEGPCSVEEFVDRADKLMYEQKRQRLNL
jgi:diguanylate cyclase (GGDEF)-like protein/PAS domain S-box-containing protein